ncbi:MAG: hypothetical protein KAS87_00400 [Candidatus Omnitrophica bacterium]|nr:hypothetical protein [Candidatus Omnitrophota bacterium]
MQRMESLPQDFVGSYLRFQIETLEDVLTTMEAENAMDDGYMDENLKRVEKNLHQIRKLTKSC